jgi:hypothetical protein
MRVRVIPIVENPPVSSIRNSMRARFDPKAAGWRRHWFGSGFLAMGN